MSLPVGERRKLRTIERAEVRADPGLASRFSIFSRLSRHEDMPRTERLKARAIRRKKWAERAITAYLISGPDTLLRAARVPGCTAPFPVIRHRKFTVNAFLARLYRWRLTSVPALDGGQ